MKSNGYVTTFKGGRSPRITKKGAQFLKKAVTNTTGQVYALTSHLPPMTIGAAMARLSRRPGDLRLTLLEEFADTGEENAKKLFETVITGYGDDSVQQLVGVHFVTEGVSNIATKFLEDSRYSAELEQSTRYIFFDQLVNGKFMYHVPKHLPEDLEQVYCQKLDEIFSIYSKMVRAITAYLRKSRTMPEGTSKAAWNNSTRATACDAVRNVLPAATKSTVGFFASTQAIEMMVMRLLAEDLPELRDLGFMILEETRKVVGPFLTRADLPDRGGAITAYLHNTRKGVEKFARENFDISCTNMLAESEPVKLLDYWPRKENSLLSRLFFASTNLPTKELERQVASWSKDTVDSAFATYFGERLNRRHRPKRALEKAHFEYEIIGDYGTFRDLHRHRVVDEFERQKLTPYFGYEVPALVTEVGFESDFHRCFEISMELYKLLVSSGFEDDAQYATLLGHKMRYRYLFNLRAMFHLCELRTGPDGHPGYRKICMEMHRLLGKKFPKTAAAMIFVNTRESEELTRLASERATQYKLEKLGAIAPDSES